MLLSQNILSITPNGSDNRIMYVDKDGRLVISLLVVDDCGIEEIIE